MSQRQSSSRVGQQVAAAARLERREQARRLVVVFGLPADRQRAVEALAGDQREREVDQRELLEAREQRAPGASGSKSAGPTGMQTLSALRSRCTSCSSWIASSAIRQWCASAHQCAQSSNTCARVRAVALDRQQRRPLVDRDAGVVGLHELRAGRRAAVELHDVGHRTDAVADQAREDAPFALGPVAEVARRRSPGSAWCSAAARPARRLAKHLDVLAGHHPQAAAAEHAIDRRPASSLAPRCGVVAAERAAASAAARSRSRCAARAARSHRRCCRWRARERDQASQRRASGTGCAQHAAATSAASTCLCTPSLHSTSISPRAEVARATLAPVVGAVADHARRIVGRAARRRLLAEMAVGVVAGQELAPRSPRRREPIDAAIADPGDQPVDASTLTGAHSATVAAPGASVACAMRAGDRAVGIEQRRAHARRRRAGAPSSAACSVRDELAAGPAAPSRRRRRRRRRRRAAPAVERAVRVLVAIVHGCRRTTRPRRRCGRTRCVARLRAPRRRRRSRARADAGRGAPRGSERRASRLPGADGLSVGARIMRAWLIAACAAPARACGHRRRPSVPSTIVSPDLPAARARRRVRHAGDGTPLSPCTTTMLPPPSSSSTMST